MANEKPDSERLARLEERMDSVDAHLHRFHEMRDDFIALKARWGMVSAIIGAIFAGIVTLVLNLLKGLDL